MDVFSAALLFSNSSDHPSATPSSNDLWKSKCNHFTITCIWTAIKDPNKGDTYVVEGKTLGKIKSAVETGIKIISDDNKTKKDKWEAWSRQRVEHEQSQHTGGLSVLAVAASLEWGFFYESRVRGENVIPKNSFYHYSHV